MPDLIPDTQQAIDFTRMMKANLPWDYVAIFPTGQITAATFDIGDTDKAIQFIASRQGRANLYFGVNELKPEIRNAKATRADVARAHFIHVDVDDPNEEALAKLRAFGIKPSVIVFSGGGFQAFWKLDHPTEDLDLVERINRAVAAAVGGDNVHNVDRIMRLPGTINVPTKAKLARGRVPALSYVVEVL